MPSFNIINVLRSVLLRGSTSGRITLKAPAIVTDYTLTTPGNSGSAGEMLKTDGSGVTSWAKPVNSPLALLPGATYSTLQDSQNL